FKSLRLENGAIINVESARRPDNIRPRPPGPCLPREEAFRSLDAPVDIDDRDAAALAFDANVCVRIFNPPQANAAREGRGFIAPTESVERTFVARPQREDCETAPECLFRMVREKYFFGSHFLRKEESGKVVICGNVVHNFGLTVPWRNSIRNSAEAQRYALRAFWPLSRR